ncbi:hypothetical protein INT45_011644, partial [Circinella minor]
MYMTFRKRHLTAPPPPPPHRQPPCFESSELTALADSRSEPEPPPPWINPNRPKRNTSWRSNYGSLATPTTGTTTLVRPSINVSSRSSSHNTNNTKSNNTSIGSYAALLSHVANELRQRIILSDRLKDGIEYKNAFDGHEAVDKLLGILNSRDRTLAVRVGRALGSQQLFHDVSYERRLVDSSFEIYQFDDRVLISSAGQDTGSPGSMTMSSSISTHSNRSSTTSSSARSSFVGDNTTSPPPITTVTVTSSSTPSLPSPLLPSPTSGFYEFQSMTHLPDPAPSTAGRSRAPKITITTKVEPTPATDDEFPNGIYTELTFCYSPTCIYDDKPCYSYYCPKRIAERRRQQSIDSTLEKSSLSINSLQYQRPIELWVDVVSKKVRDSVSKTEWKRQEAIFELIEQMWIEPIKNSEEIIPDPQKREFFIRIVFANVMEIYDFHVQMLNAFQVRQARDPIVSSIGDVMLDFVDRFDPFIEYGASQYNARYLLDQERTTNPAFAAFAKKTEEHPVSRKLPLNGYLSQPTTRIGRYNLLLEGILKYTPSNNSDNKTIPKVMETIKEILTRMNTTAGRAKNRFDLDRINAHLRFKNPEDVIDLRLSDEERQLIKEDKLRKSHITDSNDFQVLLFDHYLVIAKIKVENAQQHYIIQRPPIPVELLSVSIADSGKARRPTNTIISHYYIPGANATTMGPHPAMRGSTDSGTSIVNNVIGGNTGSGGGSGGFITSRSQFPITFTHLGRKGAGSLTLYSSSVPARKPWFDKIHDIQLHHDKRHALFAPIPAVKEHHFFVITKINHMVTFNDGRQYVLAADDGVYVGHTEQSSVPRKVLSIERVTQVAVLPSAQKLLVLADRSLYEYALSVVNGSPKDRPPSNKIRTHVPFFHVGFCLKRHLICVPRISTLQTTITVFEAQRPEEYHKKYRHRRSDVPGKVPSPLDVPMRQFSVYGVPSEVWDIELSKSLMLVTTSRGVIIWDMRDTNKMFRRNDFRYLLMLNFFLILKIALLNPEDPMLRFITIKEKDHLIPTRKRIVMFRTPEAQHIVCYDEFAFYIDGEGNRVRPDFLIEWEGTPEGYAFNYPYIIAFDQSFIEVRNIFTGEREQVIRGHNIKALSPHYVYRSDIPMFFGMMTDPASECYQYIFRLDRIIPNRQ